MSNSLHFKQYGKGKPVILIHGFPMSGEIWPDEFTNALAEEFSVFVIDLPGFGESTLPSSDFTLDDVADILLDWMEEQRLTKVTIVGHSLGGYVALAMVTKNPEKFAGLVLFHSTAYADNEEKKQSRDKVIQFVQQHGAPAFTTNFIPPLFANKEHPGIDLVKGIGARVPDTVVVAYTRAMRDRPDQTTTLTAFPRPVLFIAGDRDPGIPVEAVRRQAALNDSSEIQIIENQSHMSMVETPHEAARLLRNFIRKCDFQ